MADGQIKTCPICGKEVRPPRRRYCSAACAAEMRRREKLAPLPHKVGPGGELTLRKVCQDCGKAYVGHIKSIRCPSCQAEADRRANADYRRRKASGHVRAIGSTDDCQSCGQPYTVAGSRQRYCPQCASRAVRDNIRATKRAYSHLRYADDDQRQDRNERRRKPWQAPRACVVCGADFVPSAPAQTICSDACRQERRKEHQREADAARSKARSAAGKAARAAQKLLPKEEQDSIREQINARARANYKKRKSKMQAAKEDPHV